MNLSISKEYFGELIPFIDDDNVTDITWNGRDLWLDDLKKGRYKSNVKLSPQFVNSFSTRIANLANKNFNMSEPLLEAETDNLRISIIDDTVTNTNRSIAIRKTPAVRRLNDQGMIRDGYSEALVIKLLEALVRGHSSIIVTGDVGSGKTELVKYLTKFIPNHERAISIEDNYELRLSTINPDLDCIEIKASADGLFSYQNAIKAALRQLCKWLLMAEARSKEMMQLLEAASTGCIVMTTMHSDDVRKIPDRVVNMMGSEGEEKRNDVYNFFDVGVKVGIQKTSQGIKRSIDQICVLDRDNDENALYLIYNRGFTGQTLPKNLWQKVEQGAKEKIALFQFLRPNDADDKGNLIDTPEFAAMLADLEAEMKASFADPMDDLEIKAMPAGASPIENFEHKESLFDFVEPEPVEPEPVEPEPVEPEFIEPKVEKADSLNKFFEMVDINDLSKEEADVLEIQLPGMSPEEVSEKDLSKEEYEEYVRNEYDRILTEEDLTPRDTEIEELKRQIALVEKCQASGVDVPEDELKKIYESLGKNEEFSAAEKPSQVSPEQTPQVANEIAEEIPQVLEEEVLPKEVSQSLVKEVSSNEIPKDLILEEVKEPVLEEVPQKSISKEPEDFAKLILDEQPSIIKEPQKPVDISEFLDDNANKKVEPKEENLEDFYLGL